MPKIIWGRKSGMGQRFSGCADFWKGGKDKQNPIDILKSIFAIHGIIPFGDMLFCLFFIKEKMQAKSLFLILRFMPIGFLIGFLLIPVHEFLHAICYPKEAVVYIGVCLKKAAAYAVSFHPISKCRYIVMSLVPMILGVIPLIIFIICPLYQKALL